MSYRPAMTDPQSQALSFGPTAGEYDARRPTYPPPALQWALGIEPLRVLDLGAGTGILTRVLAGLGHRVSAVEPDPAMRERLLAATPGADALAGSAEAIPLPDGSVDAVVAGQAYHWFDKPRAHPEIARVLVPDGVFVPIWNMRDESVPWVADLTEITYATGEPRPEQGDWLDGEFVAPMDDRVLGEVFGPLFGPVERRVFRHSTRMTADGLVGLMRTRSYYITADAPTQARIEQGILELTSRLPEAFELPYVTAAYRARRR
jgi:SAM-dependent methyltransferase